eukprot:3709588-Rhodomonas_salina.3
MSLRRAVQTSRVVVDRVQCLAGTRFATAVLINTSVCTTGLGIACGLTECWAEVCCPASPQSYAMPAVTVLAQYLLRPNLALTWYISGPALHGTVLGEVRSGDPRGTVSYRAVPMRCPVLTYSKLLPGHA